jgi:hypothetical protein
MDPQYCWMQTNQFETKKFYGRKMKEWITELLSVKNKQTKSKGNISYFSFFKCFRLNKGFRRGLREIKLLFEPTLIAMANSVSHLDGFLEWFSCDNWRDGWEEEPDTGEPPPVVPYAQAHGDHPHTCTIQIRKWCINL